MEIKQTMQSLIESEAIFSALTILNENEILQVLEQETHFSELKAITRLPEIVLEKMLQILVKAGFLISNHHNYAWSTELKELIHAAGLEVFSAQLKFTGRMNSEFFKSASTGFLKPGWYQADEEIVKSWGRLSEFFGNEFASTDPRLMERLSTSGALFLDAGTGTGAISIQLCQTYPGLKAIAIDCEQKPLALAQVNIQQHQLADRIKLRHLGLQDLKDKDIYDIAWLPQVFYSEVDFLKCLQIIWNALKPSGMVYMGVLSSEEGDLSNLILQLKNATYGSLRYVKETITDLEKIGFIEIQTFGESNGYKSFSGYSLITAVKPWV